MESTGHTYIAIDLKSFYASVECIEGVVFHELAHFASIRHDAAFYEALSGLSPEWKALKKRLMAQAPLFLQPKKKK